MSRRSTRTTSINLLSAARARPPTDTAARGIRLRPDTLSIIHTGEVHETYEHELIPEPVVYEITYAAPSVLRRVASDLAGT